MRLIIVGAGGYGRVIAEIVEQSGKYSEVFFLDDNSSDSRVIGKCEEYLKYIDTDTEFYVAFGANEFRVKWIDTLLENGASIASVIHKTAYVSPTAKIGVGTAILPNGIVNTNCSIEKGVIINCGSIVDHDCIIGEGVHVCLGAVVKAENKLPPYVKVDAGVVIENRKYPIE